MERKEEKMMKATMLLKRLFNKNKDEMEHIGLYIQRDGLVEFLKNLDSYEISSELYEKLYAVKILILSLEDIQAYERKDG